MLRTSVKVFQGIVKGSLEKLPNGKSYLSFLGIPYAKKPLGNLRFKSPEKLLKFDYEEIDCTKEGDECFQKSVFTMENVGSEDCLYLNVYVPEVCSGSKLAVMFYIHGGGFSTGSSSIEWYSPEYLLMEDVIVVTINYRLHALGFISLPSMGISGNAGLKDQQLALEWVYENISHFNGDEKKICLFGESAGGSSVHYHILSSKSRNMISSAICQSGNALNDWALQRDGVARTKQLAKLLGCKTDNDRDIYSTLMSATAADLSKFSIRSNTSDMRNRNLNFVFKPIIELESEDAFMWKSPLELMRQEKIDIPIIFGTNDGDGMIQTAFFKKVLKSFETDPVRLVPISINIDPETPFALELGKQIKNFYFGSDEITEKKLDKFIDLMTDMHFLISQTMSNELHSRYQHNSKQYLYEFRFVSELNLYKKILNMTRFKGACHVDELFYLFGQRSFDVELAENSEAAKIRKMMCNLWVNFAKFSDPTPSLTNLVPFKWNPTENIDKNSKEINLNYLVIDSYSRMESNCNHERMNFWRNIYKTWNQDFIKPKL